MFNLNSLKNIYYNSPLWLKNIYSSIPYEIRTGKEYRKWNSFLSENLNSKEYEALKIKETIAYSYKNVPFYQKQMTSLNLRPEDINERKDLCYLPVIDKSVIRDNYEDLMARNYPRSRMFYVTTGGSSGSPLRFFQSENVWKKELAFINNYYRQFGYEHKNIRATIRGGEFNDLPQNIFWKLSPINNEIHFSPFHINRNTIKYYVHKINELQPLFFHGYPSAIQLLINNIKEEKLTLNYQPKAVFLISENFTMDQITAIKSFFNCFVTSFYGHSERLIFAPASENLESFIIDRRYGCFELVNNNNELIETENETGEILGTSFDNYAMPLIRYKTNDLTDYINSSELIVNQIKGRWNQEFLDGNDQLKVSITGLNMHSDIFKNIIALQFYQPRIGETILLVVAKQSFSQSDEKQILNAFKKKAGHAIQFSIQKRPSLMQTERGKAKMIIKDYTNIEK